MQRRKRMGKCGNVDLFNEGETTLNDGDWFPHEMKGSQVLPIYAWRGGLAALQARIQG